MATPMASENKGTPPNEDVYFHNIQTKTTVDGQKITEACKSYKQTRANALVCLSDLQIFRALFHVIKTQGALTSI